MATLVVQNAASLHDAWNVVLDIQGPYDLVVQGAYHVNAGEAANLNTTDLVVADASHDHVAWNISNVHAGAIAVDSSYHVNAAEGDFLLGPINISMGDEPYLPTMECTGTFYTRIFTQAADLPTLRMSESRTGAQCGTLKLPDMECTGEMSAGATASLSRKLPALAASGRFGARAGTLTLPFPEVSMSITGDLFGKLNKSLPGLEVSASGSTPVLAALAKSLPPISISAVGSFAGTGVLSRSVAPLKSSAKLLSGGYGTLTADLPGVKLSGNETLDGDSLSLNAYLPTLVSGAVMGGVSKATYEDQYEDYVLRYAR